MRFNIVLRRFFRLSKVIAFITFLTALFFFLHSFYDRFRSDSIRDDRFLQVSKCPACYGTQICSLFTNNNETKDNEKLLLQQSPLTALLNAKNVYYATVNGQKVVLKKLAQNWEFDDFDNAILQLSRKSSNYDYESQKFQNVGSALSSLVTEVKSQSNLVADEYALFYRLLRDVQSKMAAAELLPDAIHCVNERFLQLAMQKYARNNRENVSNNTNGVANLLTSLLINAEPVIMAVFSESSLNDRFPKYLGSCGRVVVEDYVGATLDRFGTAPWPRRLRLALDLLRFAQQMTANTLNMNLYWTDVSFHNFAVTSDDRIVLVDVEGIVVVDRNSTDCTDDVIHTNPFGGDDTSDSLKFSLDDLCSHRTSDHNVYAVCKCLLSSNPCSSGISGGLLWGTSEAIERRWNLEALVRRCVSTESNRIEITKKLIKTMESIIEWLNELN